MALAAVCSKAANLLLIHCLLLIRVCVCVVRKVVGSLFCNEHVALCVLSELVPLL